eukprot:m.163257 g.163257  ORF g.163257 m.163257 type:complete len:315 (-) comp18099_c0_seq2:191-1135(-)
MPQTLKIRRKRPTLKIRRKRRSMNEDRFTSDGANRSTGTAPTQAQNTDYVYTSEELDLECFNHGRKSVIPLPKHNFEVDIGDHCETPLMAYRDISPVFESIREAIKKRKQAIQLYDPYFCRGAVVANLQQLGYKSVYNKNVDFYKAQREGSIPPYDVLVTNPPYSGKHINKLLNFVMRSNKPSLLLVPKYTHEEPFYDPIIDRMPRDKQPMYFVPRKRYAYVSPEGIRGREMPVTPFESVWHLHLDAEAREHLLSWDQGLSFLDSHGILCRNRMQLNAALAEVQQICKTDGRPNPRARKRARKKIDEKRRGNDQ